MEREVWEERVSEEKLRDETQDSRKTKLWNVEERGRKRETSDQWVEHV